MMLTTTPSCSSRAAASSADDRPLMPRQRRAKKMSRNRLFLNLPSPSTEESSTQTREENNFHSQTELIAEQNESYSEIISKNIINANHFEGSCSKSQTHKTINEGNSTKCESRQYISRVNSLTTLNVCNNECDTKNGVRNNCFESKNKRFGVLQRRLSFSSPDFKNYSFGEEHEHEESSVVNISEDEIPIAESNEVKQSNEGKFQSSILQYMFLKF